MAINKTRPNLFWLFLVIALALTALRVYSGIQWWSQLGWKWPWVGEGGFGCSADRFSGSQLTGLCDWMAREAKYPALGLYGDFVKNIVIPGFGFFAWLTIFTEVFIAVSLIAGLLTRLGGIVGTVWALNLIVGLAGVPGENLTFYLPYLVPPLLVAITGPRYQYGLDTLLLPYYRRLAVSSGRFGGILGWLLGANRSDDTISETADLPTQRAI